MEEAYNEDCREVLKRLRAEGRKFALVVTSPPYNAGKDYEDALSIDEYKDFARSWAEIIPDILAPNGSFWLNVGYIKTGANQALPLTYIYYPILSGLPLVQEIVWHYEGGMTYGKRFAHRTERWMWFSKNPEGAKFNLDDVRDPALNRGIDSRNNKKGKNPTDYWYFDRVTNNSQSKTVHPCQFPVAMIERIVRACSDRGDSVLDPFMGSGSVGVAAKLLDRNFVGIELDKTYYEMAKQRICDTCVSPWIDIEEPPEEIIPQVWPTQ